MQLVKMVVLGLVVVMVERPLLENIFLLVVVEEGVRHLPLLEQKVETVDPVEAELALFLVVADIQVGLVVLDPMEAVEVELEERMLVLIQTRVAQEDLEVPTVAVEAVEAVVGIREYPAVQFIMVDPEAPAALKEAMAVKVGLVELVELLEMVQGQGLLELQVQADQIQRALLI